MKATLTIYDAWLDLQDGFVNTGQGDGRPTSGYFPLVVSPNSRAGMLFSISLGKTYVEGTVHLCYKCLHVSKLPFFKHKQIDACSRVYLQLVCSDIMYMISGVKESQ